MVKIKQGFIIFVSLFHWLFEWVCSTFVSGYSIGMHPIKKLNLKEMQLLTHFSYLNMSGHVVYTEPGSRRLSTQTADQY